MIFGALQRLTKTSIILMRIKHIKTKYQQRLSYLTSIFRTQFHDVKCILRVLEHKKQKYST